MGETSIDTKREIESLRDDISATVLELERRARRTFDLKAQVTDNPRLLGIVGFGVLAGASMLAYNAVADYRESRKPVNRVKRRGQEFAEEVGGRLERTRRRLPMHVTIGSSTEDEPMDQRGQDPGMVKKLLWAGLTAALLALFGLLARRLSAQVWELVMHEPPPTAKA